MTAQRLARRLTVGTILLGLLLALGAPARASVLAAQADDNGLRGPSEYQSPTFGYEITWSDDWEADPEQTTTAPEGDRLWLDTEDGFLIIVGIAGRATPAQVFEAVNGSRDPAPQVVASGEDEGLVWAELTYELEGATVREYDEARAIDGGVLLITVQAPEGEFEEVLTAALGVEIDGGPLVVSLAEPDAGAGYTSEIFGYSVAWDEEIWQVDDEASFVDEETAQDLLVLRSDLSSLYLDAKAAYNGDAGACLEEEAALLEGESGIVDFGPAEDEDGDELTGETDDGAVFGVFASTIAVEDDPQTDDDETGEFALMAYLECRTLVEGEAALAISMLTSPDAYEDAVELARGVIATIELADE